MEDPRLESSENGEEIEDRIGHHLDEATFEPEETVEGQGDFEMSESIESGFTDLMDASDLVTGVSLDIDPQDIDEQNIDPQTIERVAKIDSFTWKLQVAKDEVGHFRVPSLHGDKPMVDVPDPDTPNLSGETIEPIAETDGSKQGEEGFPKEVTELANLVLGMAVEDVEQDLEDSQAKQEAMNEAKQAIRDQLESQSSVEMDAGSEPSTTAPEGLGDQAGLVSGDEMETSADPTAPQARYGEAESEPEVRADAASAEASDKSETPPEPDPESSTDEERD